MDDIFKFNQHIKEIISPVMKDLGFKKTNLNFTRTNGRYLEKLVIQKSRFNLSDSEKTIFINYYIYLQDDQSYWIFFSRLNNKMKYGFYDWWSFFDEDDLIKMLVFLGKLLNNYTNRFYSAIEKYLDTIPEIKPKASGEIGKKCSEIFNDIQREIPEEEILLFNLERETKAPPKIELCSYTYMLVNEYKHTDFSAEILNQGRELTGLKVIIFGDAIKQNNIVIEKIICSNYNKEILFTVEERKINENETDKYLIFSFGSLKMNPGYDEEKLAELHKKDLFALQRASKYHRLDEISFCFYYKINKADGKFQIAFCPDENFEESQKSFEIQLREKEPTPEEVMKNIGG